MSRDRTTITRADLPEVFTPDTLRPLPIAVLRRLGRPGNGVLDPTTRPPSAPPSRR